MICTTCHEERPSTDYRRHRAGEERRRQPCRTCHNRTVRERYAQDKGRIRAYQLERLYGITQLEYEGLLAAQRGRCAICKGESIKRLAVDHDHETGRVRGLLCSDCNRALGLLQDSPVRLRAALSYLEVRAVLGIGGC